MSRIDSDFVELLSAAAKGTLAGKAVKTNPQYAVTASLVAGGYPGDYEKGKSISIDENTKARIFHAGTKMSDGSLMTDGGRVLSVTGMGSTLSQARKNVYDGISGIRWDGLYFRKDIGLDLQEMEDSAS